MKNFIEITYVDDHGIPWKVRKENVPPFLYCSPEQVDTVYGNIREMNHAMIELLKAKG